jgi:hypothetical protein
VSSGELRPVPSGVLVVFSKFISIVGAAILCAQSEAVNTLSFP